MKKKDETKKEIRLSAQGMRVLKLFHIIFASSWFIGCTSILLLSLIKKCSPDIRYIAGYDAAIHYVDQVLIIYLGAISVAITGIIYGKFTNWGFFKHTWITIKWVIAIFIIIVGTFLLGPWEEKLLGISSQIGATEALVDKTYILYSNMLLALGSLCFTLLLLAYYLSVFKPFRKK